jgi:phage replication O-like protein O
MARPQKENGHPDIYKDGHIDIAHPLAKKWRSYRLSGEEWQILWVIISKTWGWHKAWGNISLKQFYIKTEIKKPNIIRAIKKLISKNIVIKKDNKDDKKLSEYHINSHFEQWENIIKKDNKLITLSKKITFVIKKDNKLKENPPLLPPLKKLIKKPIKKRSDNFIKVWKDFKEMRIKIRKPMTERAGELIINELDKLSNNEDIQIDILNQSIMNSWQGVFPLKTDFNGKGKLKMTQEEALKKMKVNENE